MEDKYIMKRIQLFEEFINEARGADYKYLVDLLLNAKPKYNVYYNPSRNVVNIGGTGYDKGELVQQFNAKPGQSGNIKNNFYNAAQTPDETIRQIEKISKGKIEVVKDNKLLIYKINNESLVTEAKFDDIGDLVKSLHFETDEKAAEEKKIELGRKQGEVSKRNQIESGEYSLRRFRKSINYGDGTYLGVFIPGSYDASVSTLGDGPHKKAAKKVRWTQKKYDKWLEDMASNGGAENAYDMSQNAKFEPGLIDWVEKNFRGDDPLQRIQWDIEGAL
jgi:hypothetical protein